FHRSLAPLWPGPAGPDPRRRSVRAVAVATAGVDTSELGLYVLRCWLVATGLEYELAFARADRLQPALEALERGHRHARRDQRPSRCRTVRRGQAAAPAGELGTHLAEQRIGHLHLHIEQRL